MQDKGHSMGDRQAIRPFVDLTSAAPAQAYRALTEAFAASNLARGTRRPPTTPAMWALLDIDEALPAALTFRWQADAPVGARSPEHLLLEVESPGHGSLIGFDEGPRRPDARLQFYCEWLGKRARVVAIMPEFWRWESGPAPWTVVSPAEWGWPADLTAHVAQRHRTGPKSHAIRWPAGR